MALNRPAEAHGGDVFAIARQHGWNWRDLIDFSANINPLGPSSLVKPAICRALDRIVHYPEREPVQLRNALAQEWNLNDEQILLGNGATELIYYLARLFRTVPTTLALPVFSEFHRAFPHSSMADLTDGNTWPIEGLLVLTRPANPTGFLLSLEDLGNYLSRSKAWVLIDESFIEFSSQRSAAALVEQHPRLMILRSLTKFYALPGLRIGALVGAVSAIQSWKAQREPWQVNVLAEQAALAALSDTEHANRSIHFVSAERDWLAGQLHTLLQVEPVPTEANFIHVQLAYSAADLSEYLLRHKLLIRSCTGWPGLAGESVRIAVRKRSDNVHLLNVWSKFTCA